MATRRVIELTFTNQDFFKPLDLLSVYRPQDWTEKPIFQGGDILALWGGTDVATELYGENAVAGSPVKATKRDLFEYRWITAAIEEDVPIVGICRGSQYLCVMAGGRLFQDVTGHGGEHEVITQEGEVVRVSSTHHQMMRVYGTEHELLAWSKPRSQVYRIGQTAPHIKPAETEKEPEAVFFNRINALAIQFHPEFYGPGNPCFDYAHRLIKAYVLEA